jgi:hypothetical protein
MWLFEMQFKCTFGDLHGFLIWTWDRIIAGRRKNMLGEASRRVIVMENLLNPS